MTVDLSAQRESILAVVFAVARPMAALSISPFFSATFIQGFARQIVIIAVSLMAVPLVSLAEAPETIQRMTSPFLVMGVLSKEIALGLLLGFATGLVFWIAEGVGFFIDNQRGSSMAEMFDPMSGGSSSPFGILLGKIIGALFFLGGGFHAFLDILYDSYLAWPVFTFYPHFSDAFPIAILQMLDSLMGAIVTFAAPLIIAMFLAEFGLGLINRFSPQLNVFFLAMPVKSGIASLLIIVYLATLAGFLQQQILTPPKASALLRPFFK